MIKGGLTLKTHWYKKSLDSFKIIIIISTDSKNHSEEATILAKAAMIIRNGIFNHQGFKFDGHFASKCQENALPSSLKKLISLMYNGLTLKNKTNNCLSVGQLIVCNMTKSTSRSSKERHHLVRESTIAYYIYWPPLYISRLDAENWLHSYFVWISAFRMIGY